MHTVDVAVRLLPDGALFQDVTGEVYKKLYHNECRCFAQKLKGRHNVIEKDGGTVEFDSPGGFVNIGPESIVTPLIGEAAAAAAPRAKRGGKPAQQALKPASRVTKRGRILMKMLEGLPSGESSIKRACAELGITRSLLLTHMYEIWRDHGVGYSVEDDTITVDLLPGVDPFAGPGVSEADDLI